MKKNTSDKKGENTSSTSSPGSSGSPSGSNSPSTSGQAQDSGTAKASGRSSGQGPTGSSGQSGTSGEGTHQRSGQGDQGDKASAQNGQRHAQEGLVKLFDHQLADLYYVEKQLLKALPPMSRAANDRRLRRAFDMHLDETKQHVQRLEEIFEWLDKKPEGKTCEAMDGILAEARGMMADFKDDPALDAALVCAAQKVEHYEITSYGSLCAFAEQLGWDKVCDLLEETLDEEKDTDRKLSDLAEQVLNYEADQGPTGEGGAHHQVGDAHRSTAKARDLSPA